jgi:hypothetical protein
MSLNIPKPLSESASTEKIALKINELRRALQKYASQANGHTDLIDMPSAINSDHDGRYYTKAEIDAIFKETYNTVNKNLKSYNDVIVYGVDGPSTQTFTIDGTHSIIKTFNYTLGVLTSIVLSGSTPAGIDLTRTLNYNSGNYIGSDYS